MLLKHLNEAFIKLIPKSKMLYKETKTTKYTPISIKSTDVKIPKKLEKGMKQHKKILHDKAIFTHHIFSVQFSTVAQSCPTLCDPMNRSMPGLPVHHQLPESTQTHVHFVRDAIQPSHPLSSPSPLAFNLSQHQGLFQGVSSFHQVAKLSEFQLHHQSFQ